MDITSLSMRLWDLWLTALYATKHKEDSWSEVRPMAIQQKFCNDSHANFNKGFCCWVVVNCILLLVTNFNSGLKYLREVEFGTRDEIAKRLEIKTHGLGGYRELAAYYGMKDYEVKGLENSRQPGQDVLEFLQGTNPELTVYHFCKKLKEDNMKRFDIVRVLENHLSIEKESK